ncbi:MAG TPA: hypothetical protein VF743_07590, partial [Acidimicrobiales bacterium]
MSRPAPVDPVPVDPAADDTAVDDQAGGATGGRRGACPTGHRPFAAADGLLVRLRPPAGEVPVVALAALARATARHGTGVVELTSRANLQVRGVPPAAFPALVADLVAVGLLPADAGDDTDRRPHVLVAPAAGVDPTELADVRPVGAALRDLLAAPGRPPAHPKAVAVVDGGGAWGVHGHPADVT